METPWTLEKYRIFFAKPGRREHAGLAGWHADRSRGFAGPDGWHRSGVPRDGTGWVARGSELGGPQTWHADWRSEGVVGRHDADRSVARASERDRMGGTWESPGPDTESDRLRFAMLVFHNVCFSKVCAIEILLDKCW